MATLTDGNPSERSVAPMSDGRRRMLLVGGLVLVAALAGTLWSTGAIDAVTDEERLRSLVDRTGWFGPVLFAGLFIALVPVGVPGLVFVLPAAVLFPAPVAIGVSLAGGYGSSAIGMWFARTVGRERVAERLPERFHSWNHRIAERGLLAVIALRVLTYLAAPADWLLGLTRISNRDLAIGTGLGLIPPTLLYVFVGGGVFDLLF